ncbi:MAG TPA: glycosyltransferase family 2 protein [Candidatus Rhabdochlamydia sp.]|jgi:hypothetical protein|nr:glycosyltransferase family 2 protein [Candidatus Rhabdochlamydia sp.]
MPPKVGIIILHYGSLANTIECLQSVFALDYPLFETIVVDNSLHPTDGTTLKELFPKVTLLSMPENLGYAEGNNQGIAYAIKHDCAYALLLNNDTVIAKDLLTHFVQTAQTHPKAGCLGAKIFFYDEPITLWHAGGFLHSKTLRLYHKGYKEIDLANEYNSTAEIEYACGCAIFVTKEAIETVGFLSKEFFLIWEEVDWCWRIRKAGYRCLFVPQARVWHKISCSFQGRGALWHYFYFRNRLVFLQRHLPRKQRLAFYYFQLPKELFSLFFYAFYPRVTKTTRLLHRAALRGVLDYYRGLLGACSHKNFR